MTATKIKKLNGKLTKREIVNRIVNRALLGDTSNKYNVKYVARRISKNPTDTKQVVRWIVDNMLPYARVEIQKSNFVFSFAEL